MLTEGDDHAVADFDLDKIPQAVTAPHAGFAVPVLTFAIWPSLFGLHFLPFPLRLLRLPLPSISARRASRRSRAAAEALASSCIRLSLLQVEPESSTCQRSDRESVLSLSGLVLPLPQVLVNGVDLSRVHVLEDRIVLLAQPA